MEIKQIHYGLKFCAILAYSYFVFSIYKLFDRSEIKMEHIGQFGDSMAFLALIVLSATFYYQTKEFEQQRKAFEKQGDAIEDQSKAMEQQTVATLAQSKAIAEQTRAQTLVGITANTEDYIYWLEELKKVYGNHIEQGEADRERIEEAIRQTGNSKALETSLKNILDGYERANELRTNCFLEIDKWQKNRARAFGELEKIAKEQ